MLIEQIIELELRKPGPLGCTCALQLVISITKQKFSSELLFTAKILQEAMYTIPTSTKSLTKFNPKMEDFKRVLDVNCK